MKPLRIERYARLEAEEAVNYCEQQREGLGDDFMAELEDAYSRIERMPQMFSTFRRTTFRKCFVNRFPYTVYFEELDEFIRVVAVAHQRRNEGYWLSRVDD